MTKYVIIAIVLIAAIFGVVQWSGQKSSDAVPATTEPAAPAETTTEAPAEVPAAPAETGTTPPATTTN